MRRAVTWRLTVLLAVTASACGSSAAPASSSQQASSPGGTARPTPTLTTHCSDSAPCSIAAGTYVLGDGVVLPGLTMTIPAGGWHSPGNDPGGLSLVPPDKPHDLVAVWADLTAVKSTGTGHGTVLASIGKTPDALVAWMTSNPDLTVVVPPAPATIGWGIRATSLVVGASHSAHYGDPTCPSNPRCADLFTNRALWGANQFVGVVGDEEFRIYLAALTVSGQPQTLFVVLDAPTDAELTQLAAEAAPIVNSLQLPADAASS